MDAHLDEELQTQVAGIFANTPAISLSINQQHGQSITLYKEDYESLLPYRWLRTQAVDVLIKLLLEKYRTELRKVFVSQGQISSDANRCLLKAMDAFVATLIMTDQEDYILESLQPLNLFAESTKYLLIPLNTQFASGSHWLLGLLINEEGHYTLMVFDSGSAGYMGAQLGRRLQHLYSVLKKQPLKIDVVFGENLVYQSNGYDCGVFAVGYSEYIMRQAVEELQSGQSKIQLNNLNGKYKYLLCNSTHTRQRYRRLLEEQIMAAVKK